MAPVGMILGEVLSPEVGIISAVVFLVLSITGLALCGQCQRKSGNEYKVNTVDPGKDTTANGTSDTRTADTSTDPGVANYTSWRDHKSMPPSTLERGKAFTQ
ncbi:hypothetical protein WMY93_015961 [Mugilogobius chulae]|uniref:Linker for activation of T-cells family member 2 n=1 Tax=Mugilogobius chulae TaxID=88201 RepID=A0AAW0P1Q4_9GOBI